MGATGNQRHVSERLGKIAERLARVLVHFFGVESYVVGKRNQFLQQRTRLLQLARMNQRVQQPERAE